VETKVVRKLTQKTFEVLINDQNISYEDSEEFFKGLDTWAKENCGSSYLGYEVVDVTDVSYYYDQIGCYRFSDRKRADWFYLAHSGR